MQLECQKNMHIIQQLSVLQPAHFPYLQTIAVGQLPTGFACGAAATWAIRRAACDGTLKSMSKEEVGYYGSLVSQQSHWVSS